MWAWWDGTCDVWICFKSNPKRVWCRYYVVLFTEIVQHFVQTKQQEKTSTLRKCVDVLVIDVMLVTVNVNFQQTWHFISVLFFFILNRLFITELWVILYVLHEIGNWVFAWNVNGFYLTQTCHSLNFLWIPKALLYSSYL